MIDPYKDKATLGAKKAVGQLQKVMEMIEQDSYCMDVLNQVRAVEGLLNSLSVNILESHLHTCAGKALTSKNKTEREQMIAELVKAFKAAKK